MSWSLGLAGVLCASLAPTGSAFGQSAASAAASAPAGEPAAESQDSPRESLRNYFAAVRLGRWDDAARYLELSSEQSKRGGELARRLKGVIDDHDWLELESVSADPHGRLEDGLPKDVDEVYEFRVGDRVERMRMVRTHDERGAFWRFAPGTVARIDGWYAALPDRWLRETLITHGADSLLLPGPFELLWWQWLALPALGLLAWLAGLLLGRLTHRILAALAMRSPNTLHHQFVKGLSAPLVLIWTVNLFWLGTTTLVLTTPAREAVRELATAGVVIAVFAALWLGARLIGHELLNRPWAVDNPSARTLVTVGSNVARAAILVLAVLTVLSAFGYPVGSLVAGLGLGGLALALGAQKAVENLIGSIAIAVDQPFRVGDFVRIDDVVGTVEHVGMRSTRVRTLDRTLVTVPNGALSNMRLESFQARDRMRLATTLGVEYGTTQEQMQQILAGFERVLRDHPKLWPDAVVVRFAAFGDSSLDIEIMAWFQVPTWAEFQQCRQEVLLGFMQVVEDAGTSFAFPTRTVHVVGTSGDTQPSRREESAPVDAARSIP